MTGAGQTVSLARAGLGVEPILVEHAAAEDGFDLPADGKTASAPFTNTTYSCASFPPGSTHFSQPLKTLDGYLTLGGGPPSHATSSPPTEGSGVNGGGGGSGGPKFKRYGIRVALQTIKAEGALAREFFLAAARGQDARDDRTLIREDYKVERLGTLADGTQAAVLKHEDPSSENRYVVLALDGERYIEVEQPVAFSYQSPVVAETFTFFYAHNGCFERWTDFAFTPDGYAPAHPGREIFIRNNLRTAGKVVEVDGPDIAFRSADPSKLLDEIPDGLLVRDTGDVHTTPSYFFTFEGRAYRTGDEIRTPGHHVLSAASDPTRLIHVDVDEHRAVVSISHYQVAGGLSSDAQKVDAVIAGGPESIEQKPVPLPGSVGGRYIDAVGKVADTPAIVVRSSNHGLWSRTVLVKEGGSYVEVRGPVFLELTLGHGRPHKFLVTDGNIYSETGHALEEDARGLHTVVRNSSDPRDVTPFSDRVGFNLGPLFRNFRPNPRDPDYVMSVLGSSGRIALPPDGLVLHSVDVLLFQGRAYDIRTERSASSSGEGNLQFMDRCTSQVFIRTGPDGSRIVSAEPHFYREKDDK